MKLMFHAPPGWPEPPPGWSPPPGWEPNPSWPPPPPGWRLLQRPNRDAFRRAFSATGALYIATLVLVFTSPAAENIRPGVVVGHLLSVVLLMPALVVGTVAFFSSRRWGWGRYVVAVFLAEVASLMLSTASQASTAVVGG